MHFIMNYIKSLVDYWRKALREGEDRITKLVGIDNVTIMFITHDGYLIGLSYKPELCGVPIVAVKSSGEMAKAIARYVERRNVPFYNHYALARELFDTGYIGKPIPKTTYTLVARALLQLGIIQVSD